MSPEIYQNVIWGDLWSVGWTMNVRTENANFKFTHDVLVPMCQSRSQQETDGTHKVEEVYLTKDLFTIPRIKVANQD